MGLVYNHWWHPQSLTERIIQSYTRRPRIEMWPLISKGLVSLGTHDLRLGEEEVLLAVPRQVGQAGLCERAQEGLGLDHGIADTYTTMAPYYDVSYPCFTVDYEEAYELSFELRKIQPKAAVRGEGSGRWSVGPESRSLQALDLYRRPLRGGGPYHALPGRPFFF